MTLTLSRIVVAKVTCGQEKERQSLSLFIKSTHDNKATVDFVNQSNMDVLEISFYKEILPRLINFEMENMGTSDLEKMFPKFVCGEAGDFYLILENVCARGLKLAGCNEGFSHKKSEELVKKVILIIF